MIPKLTVKDFFDTLPNSITDYDYGAAYVDDKPVTVLDMALALARTMQLRATEAEAARDQLARRCAEQARHIAGLLELQAEEAAETERHPLADAIATMQKQGVR